MKDKLDKIGIQDKSFNLYTVEYLIRAGIIEKPLDGNHGEIHPKGTDFIKSGIPFVMASDIIDGQVDYISCNFISQQQAEGLRKGFARNGDVLLTHKATIGRTAIVNYFDHPYIILTPQVTYYRVKDNKKLNNNYLKYYFDSELFQKTISLWSSSGSTRAYIGITAQQKLPVILPPIDKQLKISEILCAYDNLIQINRQRIDILEKFSQQLYKEWFVRMRFPGWEKTSFHHGLPHNWERKKIGDISLLVTRGITPIYNDNGESIVINQKCIRNGKLNLKPSQKQTKNIPNNKKIQKNDVLVNSTGEGTLGRVAMVTKHYENCTVDTHVTIARPNIELVDPIYYGFTLLNYQSIFEFMAIGATGQTELGRKDIINVEIELPTQSLQTSFSVVVNPILDQIKILLEKNEILNETRNLLLPRLISGKLTIKQAEALIP